MEWMMPALERNDEMMATSARQFWEQKDPKDLIGSRQSRLPVIKDPRTPQERPLRKTAPLKNGLLTGLLLWDCVDLLLQ